MIFSDKWNEDSYITEYDSPEHILSMDALMRSYTKHDPFSSKEFHGHTDIVWCCALTSNNEYMFSGSADKLVKIWNASSGEFIGDLEGHTSVVYILTITPDDSRVISGGWDFKVIVWDWLNRSISSIISTHTNQVYALALPSDGSFLVSGGADYKVRVWNFAENRENAAMDFGIYIFGITLTKDNKEAIVCGGDQKYGIYSLTSLSLISFHVANAGIIQSVALTPDNKFMVLGTQKNLIKVYNYPAKTEYCTFTTHENQVRSVACTLDSKYVISSSSDKTVRIFNIVDKSEELILEGCGGYIYGQFLSRDGQYLVTAATDKLLRMWKIGDKIRVKKLSGHTAAMRCLTLSSDSKYAFSGSDDKTIRKWDIKEGTCVSILRGNTGNIMALSVTEDLRYIFNAAEDSKVLVWDYTSCDFLTQFCASSSFVACVATSRNSLQVVFGGGDMKVYLYNIQDFSLAGEMEGHTNAIFAITFTSDNNFIVTGSADKTIRVWDVEIKLQISKFETGTAMINCLALNKDDSLLVFGCRDNFSYIWDWKEKKLLKKLAKHTGWIQCVNFADDGNKIVTAAMDGVARVWSAREETHEFQLVGHASAVRWAEFTRDGKYIVSDGHDMMVIIWDTYNVGELELVDIGGSMDSFLFLAKIKKKMHPKDIICNNSLFSPLGVNIVHIYSYLGYDSLLEEALNLGIEIRINKHGHSPLHYALMRKTQSCVDTILEFLVKLKDDDFEAFLNYTYALRGDIVLLLSNRSDNLPDFLDAIFYIVTDVTNFAAPRVRLPCLNYSSQRGINPYYFVYEIEKMPIESIEIPVEFRTIPFPIPNIHGSQSSINILRSITECPNKKNLNTDFIKTYVRNKWDALWKYILFHTFLMWTNLILMTTLIMMFSSGESGTPAYIVLVALFLIVNGLLGCYEMYQAATEGIRYFYASWNIIDLIRFCLCATWIIMSLLPTANYIRTVTWFMVIFNFFRGLSGFRAFNTTRYYTKLIIRAFFESISFLIVFFYSTFAFGVLYIAANAPSSNDIGNLWTLTFEMDMGNFDNSGMDKLEYTGFMLASIINVIVILNLLISILGNSFDSFQTEAEEIDCFEMAELVLEIETMMSWNRDSNQKVYMQVCEDLSGRGYVSWEGRIKTILKTIDGIKKESNENFEKIRKENNENFKKIMESHDEIKKTIVDNYKTICDMNDSILLKLH